MLEIARKRLRARNFIFRLHFGLLLCMALAALCDSGFVFGSETYYYLHISSFRVKDEAVRDVERLRHNGYNAITKREHIPNKGYWHRVYVGPFISLQEARLNMEELRKEGLGEYMALRREGSLILIDSEKMPAKEEEEERVEEKKAPPSITKEEHGAAEQPLSIAIVKPAGKIIAQPPLETPISPKKERGRHAARGTLALGACPRIDSFTQKTLR